LGVKQPLQQVLSFFSSISDNFQQFRFFFLSRLYSFQGIPGLLRTTMRPQAEAGALLGDGPSGSSSVMESSTRHMIGCANGIIQK
jgi:hypothetical protein